MIIFDGMFFFIIETSEKKLKKIKLAETLLYGPTKYIKVEDPFSMGPQKMKLAETLLYGSTKNEIRRNPFIRVNTK